MEMPIGNEHPGRGIGPHPHDPRTFAVARRVTEIVATAVPGGERSTSEWSGTRSDLLQNSVSGAGAILASVTVLGGELAVPCTRNPLERG
jgi:hypothetical protein